MGIKALRKLQLGLEAATAAGTAVAATVMLRGTGALEDKRVIQFANEDIGILGGANRSYIPWKEGALQMDMDGTFEQLPYILACGVQNSAATADGSGYVYTFAFPTTAANTINCATLEGGDDVGCEEMEYSFVDNFKISGTPKENIKVNASWIGRQISASTFTSLAVPTVNEILFTTAKLYIDATSTYPASTVVSNTLLGMTLDVKTGWKIVPTAGASDVFFDFIKNTGAEINMDITFEHNSSALSEIAAFKAGTARSIKLLFEGKALGTPGVFSKYSLVIQLAGTWLSFSQLGEQDGNDIVSGKFRAMYDATAGAIGTIIVVNETASL